MPKTEPLETQPFIATRNHHRSEIAEDYTEIITELQHNEGEARVSSIAKRLGVSHVTVLRTLRRLEEAGLVVCQNRGPVALSEEGKKLAEFAFERHRAVVALLTYIGVSKEVAEIDAEGAEHHFSNVTVAAITNFLKTSSADP